MNSRLAYGLVALASSIAICGCGGDDGERKVPQSPSKDAGRDTSSLSDTGARDTGTADSSTGGTGSIDSGASDTGSNDSGASDTGSNDSGTSDAGSNDSGASDAGSNDSGVADASGDGGSTDASGGDAGTPDARPDCIGDASMDAGCLVALAVFSTGVDSTRVSLAGGSVDPHYTLVVSPDTTFTGPNAIVVSQIADGYWVPQSATSMWIAPSANQSYPGATPCNAGGTYVYRTGFDLTGLDSATARITGQWGADNSGAAVRLNGVSLGITAAGYSPLTPFTIDSGFVAGVNTLEFEVFDFGCPNGLRVEMTGTAVLRP